MGTRSQSSSKGSELTAVSSIVLIVIIILSTLGILPNDKRSDFVIASLLIVSGLSFAYTAGKTHKDQGTYPILDLASIAINTAVALWFFYSLVFAK